MTKLLSSGQGRQRPVVVAGAKQDHGGGYWRSGRPLTRAMEKEVGILG